MNKKVVVMIILVIVMLVFNQALKLYCMKYKNEESKKILPGVSLKYEENNQGAFGVGQNDVITYVISTAVVVIVVLKFFINQIEQINMGIIVGISMILAGGLSNMIDKIFHGYIINYIQLINFPAINLSFILIVIAWVELAAIFAFNIMKGNDEKKCMKE